MQVAPGVTLRLSASRTAVRRPVVLRGVVTPPAPGCLLEVQRRGSGGWRSLAWVPFDRAGGYRHTLRPRSRGAWTLRVVLPADAERVTGTSPGRALTVH